MDVPCVWTCTMMLHVSFYEDFSCSVSYQHPCDVHLGSSCLPLHCDGWRGARWNAPEQVQWMCTKIGKCMWSNWLEVTRATSRSEEVRLQEDQPHRGLHLVAGGIQGISLTIDYHQLQPGGIRSRERHFCKELEESVSSAIVVPLCRGL